MTNAVCFRNRNSLIASSVEIVVEGGEIGGEHQLQPRRGLIQGRIGAGEGGPVLVVEVLVFFLLESEPCGCKLEKRLFTLLYRRVRWLFRSFSQ